MVMTNEQASTLKRGDILRIPNPERLTAGRQHFDEIGLDFDHVVVQRIERRIFDDQQFIVCIEHPGVIFGVWPRDVELCEGPW